MTVTVPAHDHAPAVVCFFDYNYEQDHGGVYYVTRGQFPGWVVYVHTKITGHNTAVCQNDV